MSLVLTFCTAVLFGVGTWLLLQRRLTRIIIGLGLMGHGANLLMMLSGRDRGVAPFIGSMLGRRYADPMPQALALTAIVISFGVGALLLALAYRSWQLTGDDLVEDDVEDRRIALERRIAIDEEVADQEALGASFAEADAGVVGPGEETEMRVLLPLPVILPLLGAGLCMAFARRRWIQRIISVAVLSTTTGVSVAILVHADRYGPAATFMGGWKAPVGIALVADRFTGLMLVVASPVLLAVLIFAIGQPGTENEQPGFHPVYLVLAAGIGLSFLTGDLFNLFVAFEMMLTASYVLITLGGRADQVRTGMTYVVINLIASTFFVAALGLLYAALGTVNMSQLGERMGHLPANLRLTFALLLFVVFGIKAAVFPLFFWLPDSYPTAPTAVTAIFAGLLTKVGVYCIIRTQTLLFAPQDRPSTFILVIAGLTMVIGVLGAIAQNDMKRILSFHIVSQIGYMVLGLGLYTVAGIGGAILFVMNQIVLKSTLLLGAGLVDHSAGSSKLAEIGGLARRYPLLGWLFLLPALSLAGVPPFSGFVAKLAVVQAGFDSQAWVVVGASLAVSVLTLYSMTKIWGGAFWGDPELVVEPTDTMSARFGGTLPMLGSTGLLVAGSIALAVFAGPLLDLCHRAAAELLHPAAYVRAVLG